MYANVGIFMPTDRGVNLSVVLIDPAFSWGQLQAGLCSTWQSRKVAMLSSMSQQAETCGPEAEP